MGRIFGRKKTEYNVTFEQLALMGSLYTEALTEGRIRTRLKENGKDYSPDMVRYLLKGLMGQGLVYRIKSTEMLYALGKDGLEIVYKSMLPKE